MKLHIAVFEKLSDFVSNRLLLATGIKALFFRRRYAIIIPYMGAYMVSTGIVDAG